METAAPGSRESKVVRETNETSITVLLNVDGAGTYSNRTGIGFFDHMLDLFAKHGQFDLDITCDGDLEVDDHHSVEDVGIALGQAFRQALGDKQYINRYGMAYVPMDEALARTVVDLSGRFFLHFDAVFNRPTIGPFATEMVQHFWYSFAEHLSMNLHITLLHGTNTHHAVEAIFKATARALREAVKQDVSNARIPSTKGSI